MADKENMTVLVTGSGGVVGNAIKTLIEQESKPNEKWIFLTSKDADLREPEETQAVLEKHKPTHIINLAAVSAGLYGNMTNNCDSHLFNMRINSNILESSKNLKVKKVVSCLSTSIYPDKTTYPIDESMLHNGKPHPSNAGYAYAKRMIDVMNHVYNKQYGCHFTSVILPNVYGPHDNFNLATGHVLPSLIHKVYKAKQTNSPLTIWGTGKALRQFIYSMDVAKLMVWLLHDYEEIEPIILSIDEKDEISIKEAAETLVKAFDFKGEVIYDTSKSDGQLKKTANNAKMRKFLPHFQFTPFEQGIKETVDWFVSNYESARK